MPSTKKAAIQLPDLHDSSGAAATSLLPFTFAGAICAPTASVETETNGAPRLRARMIQRIGIAVRSRAPYAPTRLDESSGIWPKAAVATDMRGADRTAKICSAESMPKVTMISDGSGGEATTDVGLRETPQAVITLIPIKLVRVFSNLRIGIGVERRRNADSIAQCTSRFARSCCCLTERMNESRYGPQRIRA
jgi:hypothetical protein